MKVKTQWTYTYIKPRALSQEPCELKDDLPFKSIVERKLEAEAMGEAYEMALRKRFMMPENRVDPLDVVQDMDSITTPMDDIEDIGDAQKAYALYMSQQRQKEMWRAQVKAREKQEVKETPPPAKEDGSQK